MTAIALKQLPRPCRAGVHVVDGELPGPQLAVILGHEIVGRIKVPGAGVTDRAVRQRVGISRLANPINACAATALQDYGS